MVNPTRPISIKTCHYDGPAEFLNAISRRSKLLPSHRATVSNWMYRGQAQSNWPLIPVALREPDNILDQLHLSTRDNHWHQICSEAQVLKRFLEFADRSGLAIPEDSHDFRIWLARCQSADYRQDLQKGDEEWPHRRVLSSLAIAQHYGIPTRLLDWTWNPFTAAYFAASDAARRRQQVGDEQSTDSNFAVWAFSTEWLGFAQQAMPHCGDECRTGIVTTPYACCPNLQAQEGVFTCRTINQSDFPASTTEPSIDAEVAQIQETLSKWAIQDVTQLRAAFRPPEQPLLRFTFPIEGACHLLRELMREGFTAAKHFPGFHGAAKAVMEWPLLSLSVADD